MSYESRNPATGQQIRIYEQATTEQIEIALARASQEYQRWSRLSFEDRAAPLYQAANLLEGRAEDLGRLMAEEMGKPLKEGISEANKCAWVCRYYAEHAKELLAPVPHSSDGSDAYVRYDPIGTVFAIMPWNFPFWQVFRFAAPTLMAGNVGLLKHAPNVAGCAEAIVGLLYEAGFPDGTFQHLVLDNDQAGALVEDERIAAVTLTGSTRAGKAVAQRGGGALKPMVMELGGSDPFIVFDDADLDQALDAAVNSRCLNNGQSCIAAKRFLIHTDVYDTFKEGMLARMQKRVMGDPCEDGVTLGPIAREDLRDQLHEQVQASVKAGASVLCGGTVPKREGYFYPATVLELKDADNPAFSEELFGPVAPLYRFEHELDMLAVANDTVYGLGASLWTQDKARIQRLVAQINAGNVFVNGMVKSDPRLPFGGIKESGFGRELGREGILAFVNTKTIWVA